MTMQSTLHTEEHAGEKQCLKCGEWFPESKDFFPALPNGKLKSPCHWCIDDKRQRMAAETPCCVPGCTNPRHNWRSARCRQHSYYHMVIKPQRVARKELS